LCNFLHSPVTSSLVGPNILLSTLFSNTLSLRCIHRETGELIWDLKYSQRWRYQLRSFDYDIV
jgi:hypothetical protein